MRATDATKSRSLLRWPHRVHRASMSGHVGSVSVTMGRGPAPLHRQRTGEAAYNPLTESPCVRARSPTVIVRVVVEPSVDGDGAPIAGSGEAARGSLSHLHQFTRAFRLLSILLIASMTSSMSCLSKAGPNGRERVRVEIHSALDKLPRLVSGRLA
jgi:hypothetical protein